MTCFLTRIAPKSEKNSGARILKVGIKRNKVLIPARIFWLKLKHNLRVYMWQSSNSYGKSTNRIFIWSELSVFVRDLDAMNY